MTDEQDDIGDEDWQEIQQQLKDAGLDVQLVDGGEGDEGEADDYADDTILAIFDHSERGNIEDLEKILSEASQQIELNTPGPDGDTALHLACLYGHLPCADLLIKKGASANTINQEDGSSALHDAAAGGYLDICRLLLEHSSEDMIHKADMDGDTPLHNAARGNHAEVVEFLLSKGADPSILNSEGKTPAGEAEEREVVALLVKAAATVKKE
ncbi:hypothetical protein CEUSTIGMA_g5051.t1 [Chlamydomonas eustigma]|uniref:Uncharacterized protein n=1 Tax=Chlamydomonas eustigma TaxID=1157962 RepID=A0A250X3F7_9CHLO|nr:hypothetical protein CEUSTIGMA_g5051.t1 [Chlamydomonas eustigma]|eukprot:GAX77607.1 hypothetical protein CEUSTIGMA_g5051.t1 [Chlamydomonas eustigma]